MMKMEHAQAGQAAEAKLFTRVGRLSFSETLQSSELPEQ